MPAGHSVVLDPYNTHPTHPYTSNTTECPAGGSTEAKVTRLLVLYEGPGALVSYQGFHDVGYATMLSGNGVKTVGCSYEELHEPLRLTMLSGNGALDNSQSFAY